MSEVQKEKTDEQVVQEFLAQGRDDLDSLSDSQLDLYLIKARDYNPEEQEQPKEEEPTPPEEPEIPEIDNAIPEFDKHKEYRDALAEANKYKQLYSDRESKLSKMKEDPEFAKKQLGFETEVKVDENKDYLDDKYLATLEAKVNELESWKTNYEEETQKTRKELEAEKQQLQMFDEIQGLQGQYSGLKTSESFRKIDSKVTSWKNGLVSAGLDPNKYLADKEYKKALDAKGYKLDVKEVDIPKVMNVYKVYSNYLKEQEAGYNTSIERSFRTSEVFEEVLKNQYGSHHKADDDAINRAIEERANEPSILDTGSAPSSQESLMDLIEEQSELLNITQRSDAQNRRLNELDRLLP